MVPAVALRGEGAAEILAAMDAHIAHLRAEKRLEEIRKTRAYEIFLKLLRDGAVRRLLQAALARPDAAALVEAVRAGRIDPHAAADGLIARLELATPG